MDKSRVLKAAYLSLGARKNDPAAERLLERVYEENESVFSPRSISALYAVEPCDAGVRFVGTDIFLEGGSIARHLAGASHALFQAFTLGASTDKRIKELSYVRPSESVALDAIASFYAEQAADEDYSST